MKKHILILLVLFISIPSFAQKKENQEISKMKEAQSLVNARKYESAFKLLNDFDPKNELRDIVLMKHKISMNYFASHINFQTFFFKDLAEGEMLESIRNTADSYTVYHFPLNEVLDTLLKKNPKDYLLHLTLGNYYYTVYLRYVNDWVIKQDELFTRMDREFSIANDAGQGDFTSHYVIANFMLNAFNFSSAIDEFTKSLSYKEDDGSANYNLAYCYMSLEQNDSALKYALRSFDLYTEQNVKGDAARMVGKLYENKNDLKSSSIYYDKSIQIDSLNPNSYLYLIESLLRVNDFITAENVVFRYLTNILEHAEKHSGLDDVYNRYSQRAALIAIYTKSLDRIDKKLQSDILASRYYFLGQLFLKSENKIKAKESFLKAKDLFSLTHEKDDANMIELEEAIRKTN